MSASPFESPSASLTDGIDPELLARARGRLDEIYLAVEAAWPGFIARDGQRAMMQTALLTFLSAKTSTGKERDGRNLAQIEAGTGTGKTLGYLLPAIVASELLDMSVIVSTATVALQEQIFLKDLPALKRIVPSLSYDLLKGRGRYVCQARLETLQTNGSQDDWLAEFEDDTPAAPQELSESSVVWVKDLARKLNDGEWNGERDSLGGHTYDSDWRRVQADAKACTGPRCSYFNSCVFYKARRAAATARLQVANHALVLSTLASESELINPAKTLFVFDEGHHLPEIGADQYSTRVRVGTARKSMSATRQATVRAAKMLPAEALPDLAAFAQLLADIAGKLSLFEDSLLETDVVTPDKRVYRFVHGTLPDDLRTECEQTASMAMSARSALAPMVDELFKRDESISPKEREARAKAGAELAVGMDRLLSVQSVMVSWATHDKVPSAKWVEWVEGTGTGADIALCASPLTAATRLGRGLWSNVSAAVCTSATLTACGTFDFFERLSGLNRFPLRRAQVVSSPFDYQRQGELRLVSMKNSPKDSGFSDELCERLPHLLAGHEMGQLVLFASRRQMETCYEALPEDLRADVQVQTFGARSDILAEHSRRVKAGRRSILFGLQSFSEGVDLPGDLCVHVLIDKLPFAPPTSPVEESLSEWLSSQGRDPFKEIAVPRAGMKLAQRVGRGVRTLQDHAVITVCDKRLGTTAYGKSLIAGLPPFPVVRG